LKYTGQSITNTNRLCELLSTKPSKLVGIFSNMDKQVKVRLEPKKSNPNEYREITAPSWQLKQVQRRIKDLILANYSFEPYAYGLGGTTLKNHALAHKGKRTLVKIDLKDFYPSVSYKFVYKMWIDKFGFSVEVARYLTKLTTLHGGLKQGFPTSSHIAAIVSEDFTSSLKKYCASSLLVFTQYVDDLNISGNNIDYRAIFKMVITKGRTYGFTIKRRKTRVTHKLIGKEITGVSLKEQAIRAKKTIMSTSPFSEQVVSL